MIERAQLFPLNFYKKEKFNGSIGKMNFRLEKTENGVLLGTVWDGPYNYDTTPKEQMIAEEFEFNEDGICQAAAWFNEMGKISRDTGSIFSLERL